MSMAAGSVTPMPANACWPRVSASSDGAYASADGSKPGITRQNISWCVAGVRDGEVEEHPGAEAQGVPRLGFWGSSGRGGASLRARS